mgnify:CR=1 FL=1
MKWRSVFVDELRKSLRKGKDSNSITARVNKYGRKYLGLPTIPTYALFPQQRINRLHYKMAIAKWKTLTEAEKEGYKETADEQGLTPYNVFLRQYLVELKEALVLYIPMDRVTDSTVKDYSIYGNDGTIYGATWTKEGYIRGCLDFDGVDDYLNCGGDHSLDCTNAITISEWLYARSFTHEGGGDFPTSICKGNDYYRVFFNQYGTITFRLNNGSYVTATGEEIDTNKWYHIVTTWDGNLMKIYANGIDVTDDIYTISPPLQKGLNLIIGDVDITYNRKWNGLIDEVKIYAKALTESEVRAMYEMEKRWHDLNE